jgi:hypothetical protein
VTDLYEEIFMCYPVIAGRESCWCAAASSLPDSDFFISKTSSLYLDGVLFIRGSLYAEAVILLYNDAVLITVQYKTASLCPDDTSL